MINHFITLPFLHSSRSKKKIKKMLKQLLHFLMTWLCDEPSTSHLIENIVFIYSWLFSGGMSYLLEICFVLFFKLFFSCSDQILFIPGTRYMLDTWTICLSNILWNMKWSSIFLSEMNCKIKYFLLFATLYKTHCSFEPWSSLCPDKSNITWKWDICLSGKTVSRIILELFG